MQVIILLVSPVAGKHAPLNLSSSPWYVGVDPDGNFLGHIHLTYKGTVNNTVCKKGSALRSI